MLTGILIVKLFAGYINVATCAVPNNNELIAQSITQCVHTI